MELLLLAKPYVTVQITSLTLVQYEIESAHVNARRVQLGFNPVSLTRL